MQTAQPRGALRQEKFTGRFAENTQLEVDAIEAYDDLSINQPFSTVPEETFSSDQPLYTSSVQPFKPKYHMDKRNRDNQQCLSFCKLVHTKNASNAFELTVVVDGLVSSDGAVWAIDTVCRVDSLTLDVQKNMWVHEVQMEQSRRGSRTTLRLIPKGSLILGDVPS